MNRRNFLVSSSFIGLGSSLPFPLKAYNYASNQGKMKGFDLLNKRGFVNVVRLPKRVKECLKDLCADDSLSFMSYGYEYSNAYIIEAQKLNIFSIQKKWAILLTNNHLRPELFILNNKQAVAFDIFIQDCTKCADDHDIYINVANIVLPIGMYKNDEMDIVCQNTLGNELKIKLKNTNYRVMVS